MEFGLEDAYSLKSPEDNRKLYAKWAKTYESEFVAKEGYEHPKIIAELFDIKIPNVQSVIDVGTGTGLVGHYLKALRPTTNIDGIDISPEMLAQAKLKNVYRNLYERDLTKEIEEVATPYDALICIGIFTHGHLGPEAIKNLRPLVKNGGYFVIAANASFYSEQNFERVFQELFASGAITEPQTEDIRVYSTESAHRDSLNRVTIFQNGD